MKLVNYVEYRHSYAHFLQPKLKALNYAANVSKKPAAYLKKIVSNALSDSEIRWTEKEQDFFLRLMALTDPKSVYYYCKRAVSKAENTEVWVYDDGELVR